MKRAGEEKRGITSGAVCTALVVARSTLRICRKHIDIITVLTSYDSLPK